MTRVPPTAHDTASSGPTSHLGLGRLAATRAAGQVRVEAGADAVELNVYFIPTSPHLMSYDVEDLYVKLLRDVKKHVNIPVAMKLSPYFSAMPHVADMLTSSASRPPRTIIRLKEDRNR